MNWRNEILVGDVRQRLSEMPDESVHCVVTSPPYWGLRDYGVEGQIGLEPTPEDFVAALVDVFAAARRVLRADGTLWLNLGDSYARTGGDGGPGASAQVGTTRSGEQRRNCVPPNGLKAKDLVGVPWMVAFALRAAGWWLRSDIVWSKPNPMPESVTDRPTRSHEYIFLLSKSSTYFYDHEAVKDPVTGGAHPRGNGVHPKALEGDMGGAVKSNSSFSAAVRDLVDTRNKRSVWSIATKPFSEAHFATFPEELVEPCILAGTSAHGACGACGSPWRRVVERTPMEVRPGPRRAGMQEASATGTQRTAITGTMLAPATSRTVGWEASCECGMGGGIVPCVVLDPFMGAGTTALVARRSGRDFVGCELKPEYAEIARKRIDPLMRQGRLL